MSRTLRSFLHQATGTRAQYMHVEDIRSSDLAKAAPLFADLNDAQFNTASPVEVERNRFDGRGVDPFVGLTWWPVAVAGFACLAVAVALAVLLPMEQVRRQLRRLANSSRLTRLPEYARVARARLVSMLVAVVARALRDADLDLHAAAPFPLLHSPPTAG